VAQTFFFNVCDPRSVKRMNMGPEINPPRRSCRIADPKVPGSAPARFVAVLQVGRKLMPPLVPVLLVFPKLFVPVARTCRSRFALAAYEGKGTMRISRAAKPRPSAAPWPNRGLNFKGFGGIIEAGY